MQAQAFHILVGNASKQGIKGSWQLVDISSWKMHATET